MRGFAINPVYLLFILLITCTRGHAQDYVVTSLGDTVRGQLKPLLHGLDKKVQVTGEDKKKVAYPMFQVRSFFYKNEIYQPVKGPEGYAFMKLLKSGYLSLYSFQLPNQVSYDGLFLFRKDGEGMEVPNLSFKRYMKKFLEDCVSVVEKIDEGELGKKELNQIIDEYNLCVAARTVDHSKIIAEKKEQIKIITAWDVLEQKVKSEADFEGKSNALEMIHEIKGKVSASEKIPNFLLEGLKSTLTQDVFKVELENALKEIN